MQPVDETTAGAEHGIAAEGVPEEPMGDGDQPAAEGAPEVEPLKEAAPQGEAAAIAEDAPAAEGGEDGAAPVDEAAAEAPGTLVPVEPSAEPQADGLAVGPIIAVVLLLGLGALGLRRALSSGHAIEQVHSAPKVSSAEEAEDEVYDEAGPAPGMVGQLRDALARSRAVLQGQFDALFGSGAIDESLFEALEETMNAVLEERPDVVSLFVKRRHRTHYVFLEPDWSTIPVDSQDD